MKSLIIKYEEVNVDMFEKISTFLNEVPLDEEAFIWFSSQGGQPLISEAIRDMLEEDERVTLIAYDSIASSALDLFLTANCTKRLTPGTIAMYHQTSYPNVKVLRKGKRPVFGSQESIIEDMSRSEVEADEIITKYLTEKEIKEYNKGEEIWIGYQRLKEIYESLTEKDL